MEQIGALKGSEFEVVVNLSPWSTPNYLASEAEVVDKAGMIYVHFPVDCSNLKDYHFTTFKNILSSFDGKKVFVHCGGNIKSSNLVHMYQVVEMEEDEASSLEILKTTQKLDSKWVNYFKRFGMKGVELPENIELGVN